MLITIISSSADNQYLQPANFDDVNVRTTDGVVEYVPGMFRRTWEVIHYR
jgi:hypothetical protein